MVNISVKVKRWGNSLGIIIPSETVTANSIKENQELNIILVEDSREVLEETFGSLKDKLKKSSQNIKDDIRRNLY